MAEKNSVSQPISSDSYECTFNYSEPNQHLATTTVYYTTNTFAHRVTWLNLLFIIIITHRRSIAERGGCFQQCLFVCLFVGRITSEQLNI